MRPFQASPADLHYTTRIHPALTGFAEEVCGILARVLAYAMVLALLALGGVYAWDQLPEATAGAPDIAAAEIVTWALTDRTSPAFAVSATDSHDTPETYRIYRHPQGGRKDILRWSDPRRQSITELEIYRPGHEAVVPAAADITIRMSADRPREIETAGLIDSKLGAVNLWHASSRSDRSDACLGFHTSIEAPPLRITGWTCGGDAVAARRVTVACLLDRLTLLSAGGDTKLAELFARAQPRRSDCASESSPNLAADWVFGAENPRLRGAL